MLVIASCANADLSARGAAEEHTPSEAPAPAPEPEAPAAEPEAPDAVDDGFEEARPQLEQQLMQQRQNDVLMDHIEVLKADAEIVTDLEAYDEGTEDTMIAEVNGEPISKQLVQQFEQQQLRQVGLEADSPQAQQMLVNFRPVIVEQLVNTLLIEQKAAEEGIEASEDLIDQEYQRYAAQFGGVEALEQQLEQVGVTKEDLRSEIRNQLPIQLYINEYLEENFDAESVEITEEELREYYEMLMQQQQQ